MDRQREIRQRAYRQLMERIRHAHGAFVRAWGEARAAALESVSPRAGRRSWEQVWQANGIAYRSAEPLSERRDQLLAELFREHLGPPYRDFLSGSPGAVHAIIDFLEVDVLAFRCGYAKQEILRRLKSVPLTDEHQQRLRQYGIWLCSTPHHRREIREAGRLMIRVADRAFADQLRTLALSENDFIHKKATRMLGVVRNGRHDLR